MADPIVGKVEFRDSGSKPILIVDPDSSFVQVTYQMTNGVKIMELTNTGSLNLLDSARLDGTLGAAILGGNGKHARVWMRDAEKKDVIELDAGSGNICVGGNGKGGDIGLLPPGVPHTTDLSKATVHLDSAGSVRVGGGGANGNLYLRDAAGKLTIHLRAQDGIARVGGAGQDGDVLILDKNDKAKVRLVGSHGHLWLGGNGQSALVGLFPASAENVTDTGKATIFLDGSNGDIVLQNADCAEDFDVADPSDIEVGAVMVLDEEGRLRQSRDAYDRRVAGVVSGAGDYRPGIVMDRRPSPNPRAALAMVGKVYCRADASHGAIRVGDLLTTSPTRGHAMRAADPERAFGAVIGKAMRPHGQGLGLIPILVALQ